MEGTHLHFGPGRLGLGLIVHTANRARQPVSLVGRPGSMADGGEFHLKPTGSVRIRLDVASYCQADSFDELAPAVRSLVDENTPMLMTTAVGAPGLADLSQLIVEVARRRPPESVTCFVACENDPGPGYGRLKEELERAGVQCRKTMVNRLCPSRVKDRAGRVVVSADSLAEWMIEGEPDHPVLNKLNGVEDVSFVPDVEPFATRKRWLIDGGHLAVALIARYRRHPSVKAVAGELRRQEFLRRLQAAMVQALPDAWHQVLSESVNYGQAQVASWCRTEDYTQRILEGLRRSDLVPFFEEAEKELAEPARAYVAKTRSLSAEMEDVLDVLHRVLLNFNSYVDGQEIRTGKAVLTEEGDRLAARAYRNFLEGVFPPATIEARVAQLWRQFRRDRIART